MNYAAALPDRFIPKIDLVRATLVFPSAEGISSFPRIWNVKPITARTKRAISKKLAVLMFFMAKRGLFVLN